MYWRFTDLNIMCSFDIPTVLCFAWLTRIAIIYQNSIYCICIEFSSVYIILGISQSAMPLIVKYVIFVRKFSVFSLKGLLSSLIFLVFTDCFKALIKWTVEPLLWKHTLKSHLRLSMKIPFVLYNIQTLKMKIYLSSSLS